MAESLSQVLRSQRLQAFLTEAETIRVWPVSPERTSAATMLIREAMYGCAIGRITHEEESRIFSVLAFAMTDDATEA